MKFFKKIIVLSFVLFFAGCVGVETNKNTRTKERKFYSSKGFALIYSSSLIENGGVDKKFSRDKLIDNKLNNEVMLVMHSSLKKNTLVKIINPDTSKFVKTKIFKKANYPKLFNIVMSKKIATTLELDVDNPYVEIFEVKKNKTFIAKESNTFEEEKNVAGSAPLDEIKMDDLSKKQTKVEKVLNKNKNFVVIISDFYYYDSANSLKIELEKKINSKKFSIKKINDNKYRLLVGPFENFNALKTTYISLNNLGFEDLNIYRE